MKMRRLLPYTYQNLPGCAVGPAIFRSIGAHWYILPAELTSLDGFKAVYDTHQFSPGCPSLNCIDLFIVTYYEIVSSNSSKVYTI